MSSRRGTNSEETLFHFDSVLDNVHQPSSQTVVATPPTMSSHDEPLTSEEMEGNELSVQPILGKGKERTMPMPIRTSIVHDLFDTSSPNFMSVASYEAPGSSSSSMTFSASSSNSSSSDFDNRFQPINLSLDSMEQLVSPDTQISSLNSLSSKGKEREFPYLPPMNFSAMKLDDASSVPGPSSYGEPYSPRSDETDSQPTLNLPLTRCRSLSNLSLSFSPLLESVSTSINLQSSLGSSQTPRNVSRQLTFENWDNDNVDLPLDFSNQGAAESSIISQLDKIERDRGKYTPIWYTAPSKSLELSSPVQSLPGFLHETRMTVKGKVRSKSSPYPISVLDFIPSVQTDIFQPLPIVVRNYFDLDLPRELRIYILRCLFEIHERDYLRTIRDCRLTLAKATSSRGRWVGRDKAVRELFKLSRVSKSWRALVFDGELWTKLDLRSFHSLPVVLFVPLIRSAGAFVKDLNLSGFVHLQPDGLSEITRDLSPTISQISESFNQLTKVNFQGCTSLTTRSLHHFLVRCKFLRILCLKGLSVVTNTTCDIIANFCPGLVSLNLSRCPNFDAHGIGALTVSAILRKEHLPLKEIRLSGLKNISDATMQALGRAAPYLEVLDLSYCRHLHNSALEAFVTCENNIDHQLALETITVLGRDLGRENDYGKFTRRVTRLRHLVLSSCVLLTEEACFNLAYSVPRLEFLEFAGIGHDLRESGLIRLLSTTPHIRRLDLEDAIELTDVFLASLTPTPVKKGAVNESDAATAKQTGYALQQLNISYASQLTDEALLSLIRNCTHLTVLEADNTRLGPNVLREFVRLSWERKAINSKIVAVDCRGISESLVKELSLVTRPRLGWRAYGARYLLYLDARDGHEEDMKIGQDECDEKRVVIKTFYSWQTVDSVKAAKEKRRKLLSKRTASDSSNGTDDTENIAISGRSSRWWSPGGRRSPRSNDQGRTSPPVPDLSNDGCRTM